jgi:hypothetical protein
MTNDDYGGDRLLAHGFRNSKKRERRLVPEGKLLRVLDAIFVPSSAVRATRDHFTFDNGYHPIEYIAAAIVECARLAGYCWIGYQIFK